MKIGDTVTIKNYTGFRSADSLWVIETLGDQLVTIRPVETNTGLLSHLDSFTTSVDRLELVTSPQAQLII